MFKFSIRPYQTNDEKVINGLFNEIFLKKRTIEEWQQKFGIIDRHSTILLAVNEAEQIVGQHAALQFNVLVDGTIYRAGQPVDIFCNKQQGTVQQRVFIKLVKAFFERYGKESGLPILFGFPGERALKLGRYKLNYGTPRPIPFFTKKVKNWYAPYLKKLQTAPPPHEKFQHLWKSCQQRYPVTIVRNADWLKRRYPILSPQKYFHLTVEQNGKYQTWAVCAIQKRKLIIADLLWNGKSVDDILTLYQNMENLARKKFCTKLQMWLNGDDQLAATLLTQNWKQEPHPQQLQMVVRTFVEHLNRDDINQRFYLTMGVSDLI